MIAGGVMKKENEDVENLIRCALINLDNLANMLPGLSDHPFFKIVKYQMQCAVLPDAEIIDIDPNKRGKKR